MKVHAAIRCQLLALVVTTLGLLSSTGCHVLTPAHIPARPQYIAPELLNDSSSQVEFGEPHKVLDTAGWIWGIPDKILLWDHRVDNHHITAPTVETVASYLDENNLPHVKVRMNQYAPLQDFHRLRQNKTVAWPYRYTLGLLSVGGETILPGRFFGGDHFNPFTQTVHLYSDVPAIALHELAHAKDFTRRRYQGTYALAYMFFPTWHETIASRDVMAYLYDSDDRAGIIEANRILYPAYGTYVAGTASWFIPGGGTALYYGCVIAGHANGRMLSRDVDQHLADYHQMFRSQPVPHQSVPAISQPDMSVPVPEPQPMWDESQLNTPRVSQAGSNESTTSTKH
ncbi:hypothetical protein [Rhodopirellula europaea]|uniref:hypothetical protein n=1 Tax=Rhodopirellula europaea TaxID=1263866 RepID=UPI003D2A8597|tara:strand:- start:15426 stop:16448 length:1023 start_codon:yes stop_codon:yes gene_type:complete